MYGITTFSLSQMHRNVQPDSALCTAMKQCRKLGKRINKPAGGSGADELDSADDDDLVRARQHTRAHVAGILRRRWGKGEMEMSYKPSMSHL